MTKIGKILSEITKHNNHIRKLLSSTLYNNSFTLFGNTLFPVFPYIPVSPLNILPPPPPPPPPLRDFILNIPVYSVVFGHVF